MADIINGQFWLTLYSIRLTCIYLIIAQIKQTSNYLNHIYLLYTNLPDATHL